METLEEKQDRLFKEVMDTLQRISEQIAYMKQLVDDQKVS